MWKIFKFTFIIGSYFYLVTGEEHKENLVKNEEKQVFRPSRQISSSAVVFSSIAEPFDLTNGLSPIRPSNPISERQPRAMQQQLRKMTRKPKAPVSNLIKTPDFPYPYWRPRSNSNYRRKPESRSKNNFSHYLGNSNGIGKSTWKAPLVNIPQDLISEANSKITKEIKYPSSRSTSQYGRHSSSSKNIMNKNKLVYWNRPVNNRLGMGKSYISNPKQFNKRPTLSKINKEKSEQDKNEIKIINIDRNHKSPPHLFYPVKKSPNLKMHVLQKNDNQTSYKPVYLSTKRLKENSKLYFRPSSPVASTMNSIPPVRHIGMSKIPRVTTPKYNFLDYSRYAKKNIVEGPTMVREIHNENIVDLIKQNTQDVKDSKEKLNSKFSNKKKSKITFPGPVDDHQNKFTGFKYKPNKKTNIPSSGPEYSHNNQQFDKSRNHIHLSNTHSISRPRPGPSYYEHHSNSNFNSIMDGQGIVTSKPYDSSSEFTDKIEINDHKTKPQLPAMDNNGLIGNQDYKTKPHYGNRPVYIYKKSRPNPNQQTNNPRPIQQSTNPRPIQQTNNPRPIQERNNPRLIQQSNNPRPIQQTNNPRPIQERNNPRPIQQSNNPRPIQERNNPRPIQQSNNPRPIQQSNNPRPIQQTNNRRPIQQTNSHNYNNGRPQQFHNNDYILGYRPPPSISQLNVHGPPTYRPPSKFSFMDILRRPSFRRHPPPMSHPVNQMNTINPPIPSSYPYGKPGFPPKKYEPIYPYRKPTAASNKYQPKYPYQKPTTSTKKYMPKYPYLKQTNTKKYDPLYPYQGPAIPYNQQYSNIHKQDNSIMSKLRRIWDSGFLLKDKFAPNSYQGNFLTTEDKFSEDKTLMDRITDIQEGAPAMLVPGSMTALGLGLAYYYFNYVWYPTPVVTARLLKILHNFTDNKLSDQKDKTSLEKIVEVLSGLESNYFTKVLNSDSCRQRLVCQLHHDVPSLWDVTQHLSPLVSSHLDTKSSDAKAFRNYLSTAQIGHDGSKSCHETFKSCSIPFISLRPILNIFKSSSTESPYGESRVLQ